MSYFEIFLLAVGLCFDTIAISLVEGSSNSKRTINHDIRIISVFGFVQGLFIFLGWLLGSSFIHYIESFDHWVAFGLLLFIGGKMIIDSLKDGETSASVDLLSPAKLFFAAVATSIDALAVGVSLAALSFDLNRILISSLIVAVVTSLSSELGLVEGKLLSKIIGSRSALLGGLILIAIGVKILISA